MMYFVNYKDISICYAVSSNTRNDIQISGITALYLGWFTEYTSLYEHKRAMQQDTNHNLWPLRTTHWELSKYILFHYNAAFSAVQMKIFLS